MPVMAINHTVLRDRLKITLYEAKISQVQLAAVARMTPEHVNKILRGTIQTVTADTILRLATSLGVSADWLLGITSRGPSPAAVREAFALNGGFNRAPRDRQVSNSKNGRRGEIRSVLAPVLPQASAFAGEVHDAASEDTVGA